MTEQNDLCKAVRKVAWGYLLQHLHFNLGTLDLLPDWLGYVLMLSALTALSAEARTAALLRPLAVQLACFEGLKWLLNLLNIAAELPLLNLVAAVLSLYFHFQLLTDLAAVSEKYACPQTKRLRILRSVQAVVITLMALPLNWESWEYGAAVLLIIGLVTTIWICGVLFSLRRWLGQEHTPNETA